MRLKSYFAATVEEAMALASKELGGEAMLVYSREASPEARYLGQYEVVFSVETEEAPPVAAPERAAAIDLAPIEARLAEMSGQIQSMSRLLARNVLESQMQRYAEPLRSLHERLITQELPLDLVSAVMAVAAEAADPDGAAREEVGRLSAVAPSNSRTLLFTGPPGSGKTTTIAKLAVVLGLQKRLPVHLISTDTHRIGGADQLRTFAGILGVPFSAADSCHALGRLMEEHGARNLLLIDTPGVSARDGSLENEMITFLSRREDIEVHLTLSASVRPADLSLAVKRYLPCRPDRLLFTRLDEASAFGALIGESHRMAIPVSYLCAGQSIPEDIEEAAPERLCELIFGSAGAQDRSRAVSA